MREKPGRFKDLLAGVLARDRIDRYRGTAIASDVLAK
jgi:hypothetical protein